MKNLKRVQLRFELLCCQDVLLREIADDAMQQTDVAKTYCLALMSSEVEKIDWAAVNQAIMKRWSKTCLKKIKNMAWNGSCFKEK